MFDISPKSHRETRRARAGVFFGSPLTMIAADDLRTEDAESGICQVAGS